MPEKPTKLQRWLDVIAFLVGHRLPVSVEQLARHVPAYAGLNSEDGTAQQTARRMFERDKDELRRAGIPLKTMAYSTADDGQVREGYIIERRDFYLPYLRLVEQASSRPPYRDAMRPDTLEVAASDVPLALEALQRVADVPAFPMRQEARSAFRKLAFDLEPDLVASASETVFFLDRGDTAALTQTLRTLSDALLARKRVRFTYDGIYRGEATRRDVAGYGLMFHQGHWYFIGHDGLRDDIRVFRVGRMSDVESSSRAPGTPDYDVPDSFRLESYAGREAWELGEQEEQPVLARIRFHFPLSLWAERNGYGTLERTGTDGAQVRGFTVHQVNPFLRWLLGLEGEAQVLEPPELRDELGRMARAIAEAHAGRAGRGGAGAQGDAGVRDEGGAE
ncbi:MAG TPA: WYL domain-containing protein [Longimicrobiales bacterium]|nr:WYL domain-containing protein [Longimicrobiales bacterium]